MNGLQARLLCCVRLVPALLLLGGPVAVAQAPVATNVDPHFAVDHVAWIVNQETLDAIATSPLLQDEFGNSRVREVQREGRDRSVAFYIYGSLTFLEFVLVDAARQLGLEVDSGDAMVAFNAEREGSVDWIIGQMTAKYPESNPSKRFRKMERGTESVPWSYVATFNYDSGHEGFGAWVKELHPEFKNRMTGGRSEIGDITRVKNAPPVRHHSDKLFRDVVSVTAAVSESRRRNLINLLAQLGYEITQSDDLIVCTGQESVIRLVPKTNQKYAITQVRLSLMRAKQGRKVYRFGSDIVLTFTDGAEAVWEFGGTK